MGPAKTVSPSEPSLLFKDSFMHLTEKRSVQAKLGGAD